MRGDTAQSDAAGGWRPDQGEIDAIVSGDHGNPFGVLGPHAVGSAGYAIRVFAPDTEAVEVIDADTAPYLPRSSVCISRASMPAWSHMAPVRRPTSFACAEAPIAGRFTTPIGFLPTSVSSIPICSPKAAISGSTRGSAHIRSSSTA